MWFVAVIFLLSLLTWTGECAVVPVVAVLCSHGEYYNEGQQECRPCVEICQSFEKSLRAMCGSIDNCDDFWTSTTPLPDLSTSASLDQTDRYSSTALPDETNSDSSYTWLAAPWIVSLLIVFFIGLASGKVKWIKSHLPCCERLKHAESGEELQSQNGDELKDDVRMVEDSIPADETHNCRSLSQIAPKSNDSGKFCGTPARPLLSLDSTCAMDSSGSVPS